MVFNKPEQTIVSIANKMKRGIWGCLFVYLVDFCLSLSLSIVYRESYVNIIFSFMGLLLVLGNISANRHDLKITSAFLIVMSILLSLSLFAGVFTLIDGMTVWSQYQQTKTYGVINVYPSSAALQVHNTTGDLLTEFGLLIVIVCLHPILLLLNVYLLSLGARLRVNLVVKEKHVKEIQLQELVLKQVELQMMLLSQEPPPSTIIHTKSQTHVKEKDKKDRPRLPAKNSPNVIRRLSSPKLHDTQKPSTPKIPLRKEKSVQAITPKSPMLPKNKNGDDLISTSDEEISPTEIPRLHKENSSGRARRDSLGFVKKEYSAGGANK